MKNLAVLPSLVVCLMIAVLSGTSHAQWAGGTTTGADVIVGDIVGVSNYTAVGTTDAFSCGTTSCNIGDTPLDWIDGTNLHPVIGQNAFRLYNNRFVQIGQSWLKHGFLALNGNLCDTCITTPTTSLGVGCSDPYGSSLNGSQGGLGPKFEVNAATGFYLWPYTDDGVSGNSVYKRLQINTGDLNSAFINGGAQYFVEAQYVAHDDSADGNSANSVSYRPCNFSTSNGTEFTMSLTGSTVRGEPAINAWKVANPNVEIKTFDVPNDGRFNVGLLITDNGNGTFTYEYAIHNQTSDRSAFKFVVPTAPGATITNIGFRDVDYHSGEPYDGTDWAISQSGGTITWETNDFATDPNANALRWATLYNFRFTTDTLAGVGTLHLFKPGTPTTIPISFAPAAFTISYPNGLPTTVAEDGSTTLLVRTTNLAGAPDASTAQWHLSVNGGTFIDLPLTDLGGGDFQIDFPPVPCGTVIDYYVSIDALGGGTIFEPEGAPVAFHSAESDGVPIDLTVDNGETDPGFTVTGNATRGQWERGVPVDFDREDPPTDSDGSGQCWLTENHPTDANSDVDGGSTTLTSPVYNMFELPEGRISFDVWFRATGSDNLDIEVTNDGSNWVLMESITSSLTSWENRDYRVADFVTPNATVQFRVTAADILGNAEIVEAGIDNIRTSSCPFFDEAVAAGTVGVGAAMAPEQVFQINGTNGGPLRRVTAGFGDPITFEMLQPSTNPFSSQFIVWGSALQPNVLGHYTFPASIGKLAFPPCDSNPLDPNLFMLTDNSGSGVCPGLMGSTGTPWSTTFPAGLNFEINVQLQGIVIDPSGPLSLGITNAILFRVSGSL